VTDFRSVSSRYKCTYFFTFQSDSAKLLLVEMFNVRGHRACIALLLRLMTTYYTVFFRKTCIITSIFVCFICKANCDKLCNGINEIYRLSSSEKIDINFVCVCVYLSHFVLLLI